MNYTYILECSDKSYYTGWTNDLDKRLKQHNSGRGAKYTKGRRPVRLIYAEQFETKEEAMKRECQIKKLDRKAKEKLIREKLPAGSANRYACKDLVHKDEVAEAAAHDE